MRIMAEYQVLLPSLGEDAGDKAKVSFWYVDAGQRVAEGESLVQMLTDKATFDVPSPAAGVMRKQAAGEGDEVQVGELLCILDTKG